MNSKFLIAFLFITVLGFSQGDLTKQVNTLMSQLRTNTANVTEREKIMSTSNYKGAVEALGHYAADTVLVVRYEALSMASQLAMKSKDLTLVKKSIKTIANNAVIKNTINNQVANLLKRYPKQDFGSEELQVIKSVLESQENNIGNLAKIYAFASGSVAINDLKSLMTKPNLTKSDKKDLKLAMVRAGDETYASKMNETLKQQVVNDDLIYSALSDVLYTKNKMMFTFLLNAIMSDAKKCSSANNDDNTPMICAYRLIEQLAPQILNFPVTINDKGEINSKDLNKSLLDVREWITKNKDTFEINTNVY